MVFTSIPSEFFFTFDLHLLFSYFLFFFFFLLLSLSVVCQLTVSEASLLTNSIKNLFNKPQTWPAMPAMPPLYLYFSLTLSLYPAHLCLLLAVF